MPTLRALECFVAVVEAGSVTEAALRLHLSQPALSHQLAALEREVGTPLLERLPRGVRATSAGRAVIDDARASLAAADRVVTAGRSVADGSTGTLRVACAESMTVALLAPILRKWHRRAPTVLLTVQEMSSADELAQSVTAGTADIAVGPRPERSTEHSVLIGTEEVVAVMPAGHPLFDAKTLSWNDIGSHPVVHYEHGNGLRAWLEGIAAREGVTISEITRTRNAATAAQLAYAGLGVALVPTTALTAGFTGTVRSLQPRLTRDVVAIVAAPSDPLSRRFVGDLVGRGIPVPVSVSSSLAGRV